MVRGMDILDTLQLPHPCEPVRFRFLNQTPVRVFFFPANFARDVQSPDIFRFWGEAQHVERDFIFRRPAVRVHFGFDIPHAIPTVVIPVSIVGAVCNRAGRIGDEPDGLLSIIVCIEVNLNFIRFNVIVPPDELSDDFIRFAVIAHDAEIECLVIVGDLECRALSCGVPFGRVALPEAFMERRAAFCGCPDVIV